MAERYSKFGELIFIDENFFDLVKDPNLKVNHGANNKRPHYFAMPDKAVPGLYWVAPMTHQIDKFDKIVAKKQAQNKPHDIFFDVTIRGDKSYILFGDMFPVTDKFIKPYLKAQTPMALDPRDANRATKIARKTITLLNRGVKFSPTAPDVAKIRGLMIPHADSVQAQLHAFTESHHVKMPGKDKNQQQDR